MKEEKSRVRNSRQCKIRTIRRLKNLDKSSKYFFSRYFSRIKRFFWELYDWWWSNLEMRVLLFRNFNKKNFEFFPFFSFFMEKIFWEKKNSIGNFFFLQNLSGKNWKIWKIRRIPNPCKKIYKKFSLQKIYNISIKEFKLQIFILKKFDFFFRKYCKQFSRRISCKFK